MFDLESTKKYKDNKLRTEILRYDKEKDEYICPSDKIFRYTRTIKTKSATGYETEKRLYQCESCTGCELRLLCHMSKDNRVIQLSHKLNNFRAKARQLLESDIGKYFRKKRSIEVESVFGDIKRNRNFRRFNLREKEKVNAELGLVSIAHNMIKYWKKKTKIELINNLAVAN